MTAICVSSHAAHQRPSGRQHPNALASPLRSRATHGQSRHGCAGCRCFFRTPHYRLAVSRPCREACPGYSCIKKLGRFPRSRPCRLRASQPSRLRSLRGSAHKACTSRRSSPQWLGRWSWRRRTGQCRALAVFVRGYFVAEHFAAHSIGHDDPPGKAGWPISLSPAGNKKPGAWPGLLRPSSGNKKPGTWPGLIELL